MTLFEIAAFILSPVVSFLEPYVNQVVQTLTSAALHRKLIKAILAMVALLMLIGFAVAAYVSFYWFYIPQRGHVGQVYLQHHQPPFMERYGSGPTAEIDFTHGSTYSQFLRSDQAYDISVRLHVPTSETNVAIGNFMVNVTLLRKDGGTVITSSRPSILTYQSRPLRLMKTAWKAVPLVLDWSKEDQVLTVPLIEHFVEKASNPVARAIIKISSPQLQIYKTSIHIDAHFSGLRYFMYYYKVATALAFISVFIFWEVVFSVVTWQLLAAWFGSEAQQLALTPAAGGVVAGAGTGTGTGTAATGAQPQSTHQLRAPTPYQQQQSGLRNTPAPRQPQLDDHRILETHGTDTEDEEELLLPGEGGGAPSSSKGRYAFIHDEMEDDDEDLAGDGDDAIVPQRSDRPQAPASLLPTGGEGSSSAATGPRQRMSRQAAYQDDSESTTTTTTYSGSSHRTGQNTHSLSMSSTLTPPPPPPPSVLSEPLSSERGHSLPHHSAHQHGGSARRSRGGRGIETEVVEEDYRGAEGDNEDDEDDDLVFGDEVLSEASMPASPPLGSSSARTSGHVHNSSNSSSTARLRRTQGGSS